MENTPETATIKDSSPRISGLASSLLTAIKITEQEIGLMLELEAETDPTKAKEAYVEKFSKLALYKDPGAAEKHVAELLENNSSGKQSFYEKNIELSAFLEKRKLDLATIESKYLVKQGQNRVESPSLKDESTSA